MLKIKSKITTGVKAKKESADINPTKVN